VLIDPVVETAQRDLELVNGLGLSLVKALNTHVHGDHVSGTAKLKSKVQGLRSVISAASGAACDVAVKEGDRIEFGRRFLTVVSTPGHTDGCLTYVLDDRSMAFTGDALLVRGCGRTDFQQGSPSRLWSSVHEKLLRLPDECLLYVGHDYNGHSVTTVAEEKALNPRLGMGRTPAEFEQIMNTLGLPKPAQIDRAVPANMKCGVEEPQPAA
jgi:sulfur dioxygenase